MECVCGCGREITRKEKQSDRNFTAASVALELLAWDKTRALPGPGPEGREGLIARGADCYQRLLYVLHEEGTDDPDEDCAAWLKESAGMRAGRSGMNKSALFGTPAPKLGKADMELIDRKHPELSYTGRAASTSDDDLVDKLERLRALREDGTLTEAEFDAAKARLLG